MALITAALWSIHTQFGNVGCRRRPVDSDFTNTRGKRKTTWTWKFELRKSRWGENKQYKNWIWARGQKKEDTAIEQNRRRGRMEMRAVRQRRVRVRAREWSVYVWSSEKPPVHHNRMRRSCSSYPRLLPAKEVLKNSRHSCNILSFPLLTHSVSFPFPSPSPSFLSILFFIFPTLTYSCILASHSKFTPSFSLPPLFFLLLSPSVVFCPPFLPSCTIFFSGENWVPV